ncbi:hypothetical protein C1H46_030010 [Malus baccata]|uniref:Uncharacterized protein n=1 Tax=Malus baccata TaxID=106549 RepID=A0A540LD69_MALBA|nr:hypothetical protein C1H46_030010 [Malus baccata]
MSEIATLLMEEEDIHTKDGTTDYHNRPAIKKNTGTWKACPYILGNECCEILAYYGINTNLVNYLKFQLNQRNVAAVSNVTNWVANRGVLHRALLIALGTGGIKPCVSSFGADQFDDSDDAEKKNKSSFFNLFYFSINIRAFIASSVLVWIQTNVGWSWGFGIPAVAMALAVVSFFSNTRLYRNQIPSGSPLTHICQVLVASFRKFRVQVPHDKSLLYETADEESVVKRSRKLDHTDQLSFLDKASVETQSDKVKGSAMPWRLCTVTQVEELKSLMSQCHLLGSSLRPCDSPVCVKIHGQKQRLHPTPKNSSWASNLHLCHACRGGFGACYLSLVFSRPLVFPASNGIRAGFPLRMKIMGETFHPFENQLVEETSLVDWNSPSIYDKYIDDNEEVNENLVDWSSTPIFDEKNDYYKYLILVVNQECCRQLEVTCSPYWDSAPIFVNCHVDAGKSS